jgi:hypothetical protein
MKKALTLLFVLTLCSQCPAQLKKGNIMVTGDLSIRNATHKQDSNTPNPLVNKYANYTVKPGVGFFISDRQAIGIAFELTNNTYKTIYNTGHNLRISTIFKAAFFTRKYIPLTEHLAFFTNLSLGPNADLTRNSPNSNQKYKTTSIELKLLPGVTYFINEKWAIEATFGSAYLNHSWIKNENNNSVTKNRQWSSGLNLDMTSFYFGMQYFLSR